MAEYIEREALLEDIENTIVFSGRPDRQNPKQMGARLVVQRIRCAPAADVAPVVHGLYIVRQGEVPPDPRAARTLSTEYLGRHENGWELVADVHADYYEWVNEFAAYKHDGKKGEFVAGDFEKVVVASSKEAYEEFLKLFPPEEWDYYDI